MTETEQDYTRMSAEISRLRAENADLRESTRVLTIERDELNREMQRQFEAGQRDGQLVALIAHGRAALATWEPIPLDRLTELRPGDVIVMQAADMSHVGYYGHGDAQTDVYLYGCWDGEVTTQFLGALRGDGIIAVFRIAPPPETTP